jgi:hypothetical protein
MYMSNGKLVGILRPVGVHIFSPFGLYFPKFLEIFYFLNLMSNCYFTAIRRILRPFGIGIFSHFGTFYQEKSGNPDCCQT